MDQHILVRSWLRCQIYYFESDSYADTCIGLVVLPVVKTVLHFSIFYYFSSCPIPRSTLQFDSVWVSTIIKMELPSVACTWLLLNSLMSCHRHQGSCLKILSYILLSTLRYRKTSSVAIFNILISANRLGRKTLYFLWSNGVFTCCYTWSFLLWIY